MIIAAPQLDNWGEISANKTVKLVKFLIEYYNIDTSKVYVYFVIGENDEYYGSEPTRQTYEEMCEEYEKQEMSKAQIDKLLVLDVKEHAYFTDGGVSVEYGGGVLFAQDSNIMGWLFSQEK